MALSRRDITLLLLMDEPVEGITRMQKYLFLSLVQEGADAPGVNDVEGFVPYRFGPYSSKLYDDLEMLENLGLITSEPVDDDEEDETGELEPSYEHFMGSEPVGDLSEPGTGEVELSFEYLMGDDEQEGALAQQEEKKYELTEDGQEFVKGILQNATEEQLEVIRTVKSKFAHYSLRDLLRHVYSKYPDWTTESEIRDKIL